MRSIPAWSLGVPLVVGSIVLARAAFAPDRIDVSHAASLPVASVHVEGPARDAKCPEGAVPQNADEGTTHAATASGARGTCAESLAPQAMPIRARRD